MEKTFSLSAIDHIAKAILDTVDSKIILFFGTMGAGKTTLIRAILNQLGYQKDISSPTFALVNEYDLENDIVYHFDFYRIKDVLEAYDIGIEDYLFSGHWCFIEWPEKVMELLPKNCDKVYLEIDGNNRKIRFNFK